MDVPLLQLDAFTTPDADGPDGVRARARFSGNPAAVVLLPGGRPWPDDAVLQAVAEEDNLSETAFLHPDLPGPGGPHREPTDLPDGAHDVPSYHLRWFTPAVEVDLCGHATLASAGVLFDEVHPDAARLAFWTRSGWLTATRPAPGRVTLDFPAATLHPATAPAEVLTAVGLRPREVLQATDLVLVLDTAEQVRTARPDLAALRGVDVRGVVLTAPGDADGVDVVSRFFGAGAGIGEDPVTGSAHSQFAAYWCARLGRPSFRARQLSERGGEVDVVLSGDRAQLTGGYRRYLSGIATLPEPR